MLFWLPKLESRRRLAGSRSDRPSMALGFALRLNLFTPFEMTI
jgi:hypothetical protein